MKNSKTSVSKVNSEPEEIHVFKFHGAFVPRERFDMLVSGTINASDFVLLTMISSLTDKEKGKELGCYATNEYLAVSTALTKRQVIRRIKHLGKMKLLVNFTIGRQRYLELVETRTDKQRAEIKGIYGKYLRKAVKKITENIGKTNEKEQSEGSDIEDTSGVTPMSLRGDINVTGGGDTDVTHNKKKSNKEELCRSQAHDGDRLASEPQIPTSKETENTPPKHSSLKNPSEPSHTVNSFIKNKKSCRLSDVASLTDKLHTLLLRKNKIMRTVDITKWDSSFNKLIDWLSETRKVDRLASTKIITLMLNWYEKHIGEQYVPKAYSPETFREKFVQLEEARARIEGQKKTDNKVTYADDETDFDTERGTDGKLKVTSKASLSKSKYNGKLDFGDDD